MMSPKSSQQGFTMIEALLVVIIVTASFPPFYLLLEEWHHRIATRQFVNLLSHSIQEAQMTAISESKYVHVVLNKSLKNIQLSKDTEIYKNYPYSEDVRVMGGTHSLQFKLLPNGHISHSGTIFVTSGDIKYKIVFLLGQGRFYAKEI